MTPVHLSEVPAPYALDWPMEGLTKKPNALRLWAAHMYDTGAEPLYTAAQLREYAMAAVLADRERVEALAGYYRELEKLSDPTPSETNSER